jgi:anaerobic magnesium-protoporphyrin IX monomethyl ester cyclase
MHHNIKPKLFWDNTHIKKNEIIRKFHSSNKNYNIDELYKYALITDYLGQYLIILYFPNNKISLIYKP